MARTDVLRRKHTRRLHIGLFLVFVGLFSSTLVRAETSDDDVVRVHPGWVGDGPLRVRNLSPVLQLYGLPRMSGARIVGDELEASFNLEIGNNFQSRQAEGTFAFFDGETYVGSYRLRGGFDRVFDSAWAQRWEWGVEIPYVLHSSGELDGLVDEFHELFGLPDGQRDLAPRDQLDYFIRSGPTVFADIDRRTKSFGDVRGFVGYQFFDTGRSAFALRSMLKLPTGEVEDLSGSEGVDVAVWGEYETGFELWSRTWEVTAGAGVSYLGEGELIPEDQQSWAAIGHLGLQIPINRRIAFIAQIDAHSKVLETGNALVADGGVLGTLGGRIGVTDRFWVDLGIIEDLDNKSASDVVFQILMGTKL